MQRLSFKEEYLKIEDKDYELVLANCNVKDKMVRDSIQSLVDWYRTQRHFPERVLSGEKLFRLLLINNFSLERTKQKIDNLFTARTMAPELLSNRDVHSAAMKTALNHYTVAILPKRLDDMTRIIIFGYRGEIASYNFLNSLKWVLLALEYLTFSDICMGYHFIVDWKGVTASHLAQMNAAMVKKSILIFKECFGMKSKSIHFFNVPAYGDWVIAILNASLSKKMGSRIRIHKDLESIHNFLPKSLLPTDIGGDNKSLEEYTKMCIEHIFKCRDEFLEMDQMKTDESKRVGTGSAMSQDLQGMQGSFRSLDID